MPAFRFDGEDYIVAPGRYAIIASDWTGSLPDPRADSARTATLPVTLGDTPEIMECEGMEMLVLPMGRDQYGATGRTIGVDRYSLVCFGHVAFVALPDAQRRDYGYASHLEQVAALTSTGGHVHPYRGSYTLSGFGDWYDLDAASPGAFYIDGEFVDVSERLIADIFGYGSDAFNATLDEHGFALDVRALREKLSTRTDPVAVRMSNMLPKKDHVIAYYAPVTS